MPFTVQEIADRLQGKLFGEGDISITNALPLQDASSGHLTLLDDEKHVGNFVKCQAVAAIVPLAQAEQVATQTSKPVIGCSDIHQAFIEAIMLLRQFKDTRYRGIDQRAIVHPTAVISDDAYVGPGAIVGSNCHLGSGSRVHAGVHVMKDCRIGDGCEIFPGVVLYPETILGDRVTLHANVVLGAYGFGYRLKNGKHERTAQLGWVEIENDVEIGANSTIDRGTYGPTRIGEGTKIDNLVQIGHNNHIGRNNLMCAQVGIAGSCSTGDYVVFGGQAGVRDHVHISDRVMVGAQSGITNNVKEGEILLGTPAVSQRESAQIFFASKRLPEMRKEIRELRAIVDKLTTDQAPVSIPISKAA
jgi:UDP-3-O-[3-hydroxymyristoyl] glucosamine N-acyltransferase